MHPLTILLVFFAIDFYCCYKLGKIKIELEDVDKRLWVDYFGRMGEGAMILQFDKIIIEYMYCRSRIEVDMVFPQVEKFRDRWGENEWYLDLLIKENELQRLFIEM